MYAVTLKLVREKIGPGENWSGRKLVREKIGPGGPLFAAKIGPTPDHLWLPKVVRVS